MTHRDVIPLLSDLLHNNVSEPEATAAWSHVAACAECRQAVTAMHEVRVAVARGGAHLFEAHPASRDIVLYALGEPGLTDEERSRIEAHLSSCATCREEVQLTRRAEAATRRSGPGPTSIPGGGNAWLAPALAAVVILLAFPAYLGLVRNPSLMRAREDSARQVEELHAERSRLEGEISTRRLADRGGPVRMLYLPAVTRGPGEVPVVALLSHQAWQPVIVQHRPFTGAALRGRADIALVRESDGATIWHGRVDLAQAWDADLGAVTLLVPARDLEAGLHWLTLSGPGLAAYEARFQVRREQP